MSTHPSLTPISTNNASGAIGPYSQAIKAGDLLFVSGCIPMDPNTGEIVEGIEKQTTQTLKNLIAVVNAGGSELRKVVKTTVRTERSCNTIGLTGRHSMLPTGLLEKHERFCHSKRDLRGRFWFTQTCEVYS
uniref:Latcripin-16 n=1 Tax=Lentinula edodes TaxID=5353 RepID=V5UTC6_LENED|nr:latcripin-16 [Lentinula edodes]